MFIDYYSNKDLKIEKYLYDSYEIMQESYIKIKNGKSHILRYITGNKYGILKIFNPLLNIEISTLQEFIDYYMEKRAVKLDYIHGEEVVLKLSQEDNNIGFLVPGISKNNFFKTIILDGSFPRKTFSMGNADDKRYYLESKRI